MASEEAVTQLIVQPIERVKDLQFAQSQTGPEPITVKVLRKLRKFAGVRDDGVLRKWIADAAPSKTGLKDGEAVDFLVYSKELLRTKCFEDFPRTG